jgi:hypothetical protein
MKAARLPAGSEADPVAARGADVRMEVRMMRGLSRHVSVIAVLAWVWAVIAHAAIQVGDPIPQDATTAILRAFDRYDAIGLSAAHSNEKLDEFILSLIHHPAFAEKVNDIVVECGNSLYQPILDRYIAGEDVPLEEVRQAWRKTTVRMCALSGFYDAFFPAIRALNHALPRETRLRVLVCEPSVDWSVADPKGARSSNRNPMITSVMTTEIFAKHRKALVLIGVGHLWHDGGTAVSAYEKTFPGRTFVIDAHSGFAAFFDLERGHALEARMRGWPIPSLVMVKGSWLADLDLPYFLWPFTKRLAGTSYVDLVDAYLYLGPGASLTYERTPEAVLNDRQYITELSARFGAIDVDALRRRNQERALFTPADRAEARQFAPGAERVGRYVAQPGEGPVIEIDFRRGVLSARLGHSTTWTPLTANEGGTSYSLPTAAGTLRLDFESVAGAEDRLILDAGGSASKRTLVRE